MYKKIISIIKPGQYFFLADVLDRLVSFIVFLIFAKSLPTSVYGQIATLFAVTTIVSIITDFGLPIYIQKESAKSSVLHHLYSETMLLKTALSVAYFLTNVIIIFFFLPDAGLYLSGIIIIITFFVSAGNTLKYFYFGRDNAREVFNNTILAKTVLLVIVFSAYFFYQNVYFFLFGYTLSHLVFSIRLLTGLRQYSIKLRPYFRGTKELKKLFILIFPLGSAVIFTTLYDRIDIVLLTFFLDYNKVAQYNVAYTVFKLSAITFGLFMYPALNQFSRDAEKRNDLLVHIKKLVKIIIILSIILIITFYFLVPAAMVYLFGEKYSEAGYLAGIFSGAVLFVGLNNLAGVFLNAAGKFKLVMIAALSGLLLNVILNVLLIPILNTTGAVISTIATEFIILFIELIFIINFFKSRNN